MPLAFSDDINQCVPFRIGDRNSDSGPRLGGHAPDGIGPRRHPTARYFATLPLATDPTSELTIFFPMNGDIVAANSGVIHGSLIEVVVHAKSTRGTSAAGRSALPGHSLILMPTKSDWVEDDEGRTVIESRHKLGGRPFLIHNEIEIERGVTELSMAGYLHVAQFNFPAGGDDALVDGPWPFVDGMFHLFGRRTAATWEWRWFWDL